MKRCKIIFWVMLYERSTLEICWTFLFTCHLTAASTYFGISHLVWTAGIPLFTRNKEASHLWMKSYSYSNISPKKSAWKSQLLAVGTSGCREMIKSSSTKSNQLQHGKKPSGLIFFFSIIGSRINIVVHLTVELIVF